MRWYLEALRKYAVFSGRSTRREYWMFFLINFLFLVAASILDQLIFGIAFEKYGPLYSVYALAVLVPGFAVAVRRLHDVGRSAWYLLVPLIPIAGVIWYIVLLCLDGEAGENRFGPDPRQ